MASSFLLRGALAGLICAALAGPLAAEPTIARTPFAQDIRPPTPDYALASSWAVLPEHPNLSIERPGGGTADTAAKPVDVFYIQPTTYQAKAHWNDDIADVQTNAWTDVSVIARQASLFNGCCRIFVPRYRQAGPGALGTTDGDQAYAFAYQDVKRAFHYYLSHYNHGRPFILAGHSQGALHIYRLIAEEIDGKPLQHQLVAAYAVGVPVSAGAFGTLFTSVQPCLKPLQTGCIVSWNSFSAAADPSAYLARPRQAYVKRYTDGPDHVILCINPLTFDADRPAAAAALNAGSLPGPPAPGPLPPLVTQAAGADCRNGVLMIDASPASGFKLAPLPGGSLHMQDLDLFYAAVRANAQARTNAYLAQPRSGGTD